jgi:hypothetical protein
MVTVQIAATAAKVTVVFITSDTTAVDFTAAYIVIDACGAAATTTAELS